LTHTITNVANREIISMLCAEKEFHGLLLQRVKFFTSAVHIIVTPQPQMIIPIYQMEPRR